MATRWLLAVLFLRAANAFAGEEAPERFLPAEILRSCPDPRAIAPRVRGCSTNFVAVEWAASCGRALDRLTGIATQRLQSSFADAARGSLGGQSGNLKNSSGDLALTKLSLDQLLAAANLFLSHQRAYQSLVAYPGGESKSLIRSLGLTEVYDSFRCVKSAVDAVGDEIAATEKKVQELQKGNLAVRGLREDTNRHDEALRGAPSAPVSAHAAGSGAAAPARKPAGKSSTLTGVNEAREKKDAGERVLRKAGAAPADR